MANGVFFLCVGGNFATRVEKVIFIGKKRALSAEPRTHNLRA
jgi:hypothetical protein